MRRVSVIIGLGLALLGSSGCSAAPPDDDFDEDIDIGDEIGTSSEELLALGVESSTMTRHNNRRENKDLPLFERRKCLNQVARSWAKHLASSGNLAHNPDFGDDITAACPWNWDMVGENVGFGPDGLSVWKLWLDSPPHRENIDRKRFRRNRHRRTS